jgi:hypothetical protein
MLLWGNCIKDSNKLKTHQDWQSSKDCQSCPDANQKPWFLKRRFLARDGDIQLLKGKLGEGGEVVSGD